MRGSLRLERPLRGLRRLGLPFALVAGGVASLLTGAPARAGWTEFLPRTLDNGAYLELQGLFEEEVNRYGTQEFRWSDTFFKEKLTLFSTGYVYHPRFLLYRASVTGLVSQERYDTSLVPAEEWRPDDGFEYDFNLHFLREHPYNLTLYARRYEPLFTERFAGRDNSIATSNGADFRYRRKPYFFHALYSDDTLQSGALKSTVERLGVDGEYYKQFQGADHLSVTATFKPSRFERSTGLEGTNREASLGNLLAFGRYRLESNLSSNLFEQEDLRSRRFESEQFIWRERLDVQLPAGFRGELAYRHQKGENRFPDASAGEARVISNLTRNLHALLSHQLFESLTSSYRFSRNEQDSAAGESVATGHQLAFAYDKTIPGGRLLLGANFGASDIDSFGQGDIVDEPHPGTAVPGTFTLAEANVEPASIVVYARSPVSPFETVALQQGLHFVVEALGNTLEIQILSLPPEFPVPGSYDFFASYSLAAGTFSLKTRSQGLSASVQLFDELLTPYVSYSKVEARVESGLYPGAVPDSTTTTAGLLFRWRALRARGEYREVEWEVSPYSLWLGELQYTGALTRSTRFHGTLSHRRWEFPEGRSGSAAALGLPEIQTTDMVAADLQQKLFRRRLLLSVGGSYSESQSSFDSRSHSLNASLSWKLGRTDFSAGATIYDTEAEGSTIASSGRTRKLFYLRLHRDLF